LWRVSRSCRECGNREAAIEGCSMSRTRTCRSCRECGNREAAQSRRSLQTSPRPQLPRVWES